MSEGANSFLDMRDFSDGPVMARTPTNVISDNILMCGYLEECAQHSKLILSMTNDWCHKSHARVKESLKDKPVGFTVTETKSSLVWISDSTLYLIFKKLPSVEYSHNCLERLLK